MLPLNPDTSLQPTVTPQPAPAPANAPGFLSRAGQWIAGLPVRLAVSREPIALEGRAARIEHSNCSKLIKDISATMTKVICDKANSTFVTSGSGEIQQALEDLTSHIFTALSTEGVGNEELTDAQLADHLFSTIIKKVIDEFEAHPDSSPKQHFKTIADQLLKAAFPQGANDPKIPILLRKLLGGNFILQWVAKKKLDTNQDLSWNGVSTLFAEYLEQIYNSITHLAEKAPDEGSAPGANALISDIIAKIDSTTKDTTTIDLAIPLLSGDSNAFITASLARLLQGKFSRQEDKELLDKARTWLLNQMKTSFQAVYTAIFACKPNQTPEERRVEFADHITSQASKVLPQASREMMLIDAMDFNAVKAKLSEYKEDKTRSFHHEKIAQALTLAENRIAESKALLKSIIAFVALELILKKDLNKNVLQPLLPQILSAETVFNQIYAFASPYLVEIIAQFATTEQQGRRAMQSLTAHEGTAITGWVDYALKKVHGLLEAKAEAGTLEPTDYPFLNNLICYALKPAAIPSGTEVKPHIDNQLKHLITIIIEQAVAAKQGLDNPEKTIVEIVDSILLCGQEATSALQDAKKESKETKRTRCLELARELNIVLNLDSEVEASFETLFLTKAAREILGQILSKELFNSLLPPFLRDLKLWEGLGDLLCSSLKEATVRSKEIQTLTLQVPELKTMIASLTEKLIQKSTFLQGKGIQGMLVDVLPKIVEAFIAYHVNPKDGLTSEKRTAIFFMQFVTIAQTGFDKADAYELAVDKTAWLVENGYTEQALDAYRKQHDIRAHTPVDIRSMLLNEATAKLLTALFPKELLERLIPKKFAALKLDQILAKFCSDYIQDAYDYSCAMKQMATTDNRPQILMFLEKQKQNENNVRVQTWAEEVIHQIVTSADGSQKELLLTFSSNIYYGIMGFILKSAKSLPGNLVKLFEPILEHAQNVFLVLNSSDEDKTKIERLKISDKEREAYLRAIGKPDDKNDLDIAHLAYWSAARRALDALFTDEQWNARIPSILHSLLTKDTAATFATRAYATMHESQNALQTEEERGIIRVQQEKGLKEYADRMFAQNIKELLHDLGSSPAPLNRNLPTLLDSFLKECCKDNTTKIGSIRDTLTNRLLYTILGKLLSDDTSIIKKACDLVTSYKQDDALATASLLLDMTLPKTVRDTPLVAFLIPKIVKKEIADCIEQIKQSEERILKEGKSAQEYLYSLDGMKPFVTDIMLGLDESLEKMALDKNNKLSNDFPEYIDNLIKEALLNQELKPVIKKALHNIVYIILEQALTPKLGQSVENRALELGAKLISLYNEPDSQKTGVEWLKELLPENRLKELLPEFLQTAITHDKLVKWFFKPYVEQVTATKNNAAQENTKPTNSNITRAQDYVQKFLLGHTKPTATTHGLFGMQGVVRELERKILGTLADADGKNKELTPVAQSYLKAFVGQITRTLEAKGVFEPHFLSETLISGLAAIDTPPPDMPEEHEFALKAAKILLAQIFPEGKNSLNVPDVAKDLVWKKATEALQNLFTDLTDPDRRLLWSMNRLIPMTTDNEALKQARLQDVENMRLNLLAGNRPDPKVTEAAFKRYTQEAAVHQADLQVKQSSLWGPFKWIARVVVRAITYLSMRLSLRSRAYNFVSSPSSNEKIRRMLWSILSFKAPIPRSDKDLQEALKKQTKATLWAESLAPLPIRDFMASHFASYLTNKNILDIIT